MQRTKLGMLGVVCGDWIKFVFHIRPTCLRYTTARCCYSFKILLYVKSYYFDGGQLLGGLGSQVKFFAIALALYVILSSHMAAR